MFSWLKKKKTSEPDHFDFVKSEVVNGISNYCFFFTDVDKAAMWEQQMRDLFEDTDIPVVGNSLGNGEYMVLVGTEGNRRVLTHEET